MDINPHSVGHEGGLEAQVAALLRRPLAELPDAAVAGLCIWWLRRRGVLRPPAAT